MSCWRVGVVGPVEEGGELIVERGVGEAVFLSFPTDVEGQHAGVVAVRLMGLDGVVAYDGVAQTVVGGGGDAVELDAVGREAVEAA